MAMSGTIATVVVNPGTDTERSVPVHGRLVVGRECAGVDDAHRLVLTDDDAISREHLEIRLDTEHRRAVFIDMSTNGTRLNGTRVERAVPVPLRNGDRFAIGRAQLEFRSDHFVEGGATDIGKTSRYVTNTSMVLVVGDIVGYSTLSEQTDSTVVLAALEELWDGLRRLLVEYRGTLNSYAGDALFAVWEAEPLQQGASDAVGFARAARHHVTQVAPRLAIQSAGGGPIRMGWAVVHGPVAVSTLPGAQPAVIGDTTNLAFRLSGVAAREDMPDILATAAVHEALDGPDEWTGPHTVRVKGRAGDVVVFGLQHEDG